MKESAARARILDVASRLFFEQGYNSTGINQIIDEAEIARASLYNHFPSKRDLLSAYIEQAEKQWFTALENYLNKIKDPKKKLLALFDYRIESQKKSSFGGCRFTKISAELPKDDLKAFVLVSHQKVRFKQYIKSLLTAVNKPEGKIFSEDMLGETLFLLLEGATNTATIAKDVEALKKAKQIAETLL